MDGRKCFINGEPFLGEVREPNVIMANGYRVAIDVEDMKLIESFLNSKLQDDPWSYTQICRAVELGVGNEYDYEFVKASAEVKTIERSA